MPPTQLNPNARSARSSRHKRQLSDHFGPGASAYSELVLLVWQEAGTRAQSASSRKDWAEARVQFEACVALLHECLARAMEKLQQSRETRALVSR